MNHFKLFSIILFTGLISVAAFAGQIIIRGEAGPMQLSAKVKAIKCDPTARGNCTPAVYINLNTITEIPDGSYIVGFENSLYPGWVQVQSYQTTELNLEKLYVPNHLSKGIDIKVFRDLSTEIEQRKILFQTFYLGRHFFRLSEYSFGDYYLTFDNSFDQVQMITNETCKRLDSYADHGPEAEMICDVYNNAKDLNELSQIFIFNKNNSYSYSEYWITTPGDRTRIDHKKFLVSAPIHSTDFVSVFPGAYRMKAANITNSVQVKTSNFPENY